MKICPNCQFQNTDDSSRYCQGCGKPMEAAPAPAPGITCPRCQKVNQPGTRFCGNCALPLTQEAALFTSSEQRTPVTVTTNVVAPEKKENSADSIIRLILGILSILLSLFISFQSCAVSLKNSMEEVTDISGFAGLFLSAFMLVAGITAIATRRSRVGAIIVGFIYLFGLLPCLAINFGTTSYGDLPFWVGVTVFFAVLFFLAYFAQLSQQSKKK